MILRRSIKRYDNMFQVQDNDLTLRYTILSRS